MFFWVINLHIITFFDTIDSQRKVEGNCGFYFLGMSIHLANHNARCCHATFNTVDRLIFWVNEVNVLYAQLNLCTGKRTWYGNNKVSCHLRRDGNCCSCSVDSLLCPFSLGAVCQTIWQTSWSSYSFSSWKCDVILLPSCSSIIWITKSICYPMRP